MAISLKNTAQACLGESPPVSVLHDVFGFIFPPGRELSLKRQLELVRGPGININAILVADDNFTWTDWEETQYAIQGIREIYEPVDLCLRKIRWQGIRAADAGSYATIDSGAEAHSLTTDFNGPDGGYLDVFVVRFMNGAWGWGWVVGPCSKDDKDKMTGAVVSLAGDYDQSSIVFAHEIGHHLGASKDDPDNHHPDANNFMHATVNSTGSNTGITNSQGDDMKSHCYVRDIC